MIKGMQKISNVSESVLQQKIYIITTLETPKEPHILSVLIYISNFTSLTAELKMLPISLLSPFLVFVVCTGGLRSPHHTCVCRALGPGLVAIIFVMSQIIRVDPTSETSISVSTEKTENNT